MIRSLEDRQQVSVREMKDSDLVIAFRDEHDEDALAEVHQRYAGRLRAFVESRIGARDVVEDIVQEAFIGFIKSLPRFDVKKPLQAYLFSICANKLTDNMRVEGRRKSRNSSGEYDYSVETLFHAVDPKEKSPPELLIASEEVEENRQLLVETLREEMRHPKENRRRNAKVLLRRLRGERNTDIAKDIAATDQQVANYLFNIKDLLRSKVEEMRLELEEITIPPAAPVQHKPLVSLPPTPQRKPSTNPPLRDFVRRPESPELLIPTEEELGIDDLPTLERKVVILYYRGHTEEQMAEDLGLGDASLVKQVFLDANAKLSSSSRQSLINMSRKFALSA